MKLLTINPALLFLLVMLSGCSKEMQEARQASDERMQRENHAYARDMKIMEYEQQRRLKTFEMENNNTLAEMEGKLKRVLLNDQHEYDLVENKLFYEAIIPLVGFALIVSTIGGLYGYRQYIGFATTERAKDRKHQLLAMEIENKADIEKYQHSLEFVSQHFAALSDQHKTHVINRLEGRTPEAHEEPLDFGHDDETKAA